MQEHIQLIENTDEFHYICSRLHYKIQLQERHLPKLVLHFIFSDSLTTLIDAKKIYL
jgi:hypothetical protein